MLDFLKGQEKGIKLSYRKWSIISVKLIFFMMLTGAFVAGLKAGHIYNTFPKMGATFVPAEIFNVQPVWKNFFENPVTVQFVHRCLAYLIILIVTVTFIKGLVFARKHPEIQIRLNLIVFFVLMLLQVKFGIMALLKSVPVSWGALHQGTAVLLLTSALFLAHRLSRDYSATSQ